MSIEKQTVAEIETLLEGINGDVSPDEKRGMWHRLKGILRDVLEIGKQSLDDVIEDNIREDREFLDEVNALRLRKHATRQRDATQEK